MLTRASPSLYSVHTILVVQLLYVGTYVLLLVLLVDRRGVSHVGACVCVSCREQQLATVLPVATEQLRLSHMLISPQCTTPHPVCRPSVLSHAAG